MQFMRQGRRNFEGQLPRYTNPNIQIHHCRSVLTQLMMVASFFIAMLIREATPMRKITRTKTPRTIGSVAMAAV